MGMSDKLKMDLINSLPQPFFTTCKMGWPVYDIDVETGLMRLDVMGKLDVTHIAEHYTLKDAEGKIHETDGWYVE
jgi:hypothetical protein